MHGGSRVSGGGRSLRVWMHTEEDDEPVVEVHDVAAL